MKSIVACFVLMLFVASVVIAYENPGNTQEKKRWQDLVIEQDAIDLAAKHPLTAEFKALNGILLPPNHTPRDRVEEFYGAHDKIIPKNGKQPHDLHHYAVAENMSLLIEYDNDRVMSSAFIHHDARWHPISTLLGTPTYSDLLHDLELKVGNLGALLVRKKSNSRNMPWVR